jgi:hypothetical protein
VAVQSVSDIDEFGLAKLRGVKQVECFRTELELQLLGDVEGLEQPEVHRCSPDP